MCCTACIGVALQSMRLVMCVPLWCVKPCCASSCCCWKLVRVWIANNKRLNSATGTNSPLIRNACRPNTAPMPQRHLVREATTDWDAVLGTDGPADSVPVRAHRSAADPLWRAAALPDSRAVAAAAGACEGELALRDALLAVAGGASSLDLARHLETADPDEAESFRSPDRCGWAACKSHCSRLVNTRTSCCMLMSHVYDELGTLSYIMAVLAQQVNLAKVCSQAQHPSVST